MKRIFTLLLLICLLLPFTVYAEDEPFTLRNGYTWGMSDTEARLLALSDGFEIEYDTDLGVIYANVPVGDFSMHMLLSFSPAADDAIVPYPTLSAILYASDALPAQEAASMYNSLMLSLEALYGSPETTDGVKNAQWQLPDTSIALSRNQSIDSSLDENIPYTETCSVSYNESVQTKNNGL